jgi:hypothetical protein
MQLMEMLKGIEESILEYAGTEHESWVWAAVSGACVRLEISIPENTDSEIEDNLDDPTYDREFVEGVNADYKNAKQEFEVAVREFYGTGDFLKLRRSINDISFFY